MKNFLIPKPKSGGLILSYKCSGKCKHCMYFGSPKWSGDWITVKDLVEILTQLSNTIQESPYGSENVSLNYGIHFTGGEPFLNYDLLLKAVEIGKSLNIPSIFVETNCFWCKNDNITKERLVELKKNGLNGILISVNPFILEFVPFEHTERAIRLSMEVFRSNLMIYQLYYYSQFKELNIKEKLPLEKYLQLISIDDLKRRVELFKMGRAAYKLQNLYKKYQINSFFNENCATELVRNWHCHFDNYGNYMPGYCGGLSWGDIRNLDSLSTDGINLDEYPILRSLIIGRFKELYKFSVNKFGYNYKKEGYISKCHACFDIRRHLILKSDQFKELNPTQYYLHI
ncbi:MAG: radical SAM protein [Candidatus Hodarchaeota archaeon]